MNYKRILSVQNQNSLIRARERYDRSGQKPEFVVQSKLKETRKTVVLAVDGRLPTASPQRAEVRAHKWDEESKYWTLVIDGELAVVVSRGGGPRGSTWKRFDLQRNKVDDKTVAYPWYAEDDERSDESTAYETPEQDNNDESEEWVDPKLRKIQVQEPQAKGTNLISNGQRNNLQNSNSCERGRLSGDAMTSTKTRPQFLQRVQINSTPKSHHAHQSHERSRTTANSDYENPGLGNFDERPANMWGDTSEDSVYTERGSKRRKQTPLGKLGTSSASWDGGATNPSVTINGEVDCESQTHKSEKSLVEACLGTILGLRSAGSALAPMPVRMGRCIDASQFFDEAHRKLGFPLNRYSKAVVDFEWKSSDDYLKRITIDKERPDTYDLFVEHVGAWKTTARVVHVELRHP